MPRLTGAGSGKTLIAVLLIRHICEQELEDRVLGKPHRVTFFLVRSPFVVVCLTPDIQQVDSVTLAFQQHDVLKANLDHPMNVFCGDMNTDFWNRAIWTKHLSKNRIIVCTAEVLRHALHHSFISINQINLLIFDEAHHAKKDHPYARIIKDFYLEAQEPRPKIFGMTASPVDSKTDIKKAARELETLLHAHICTTKDPELAQYTITKSSEEVWSYSPLGPEYQTELGAHMRECFKNNAVLKKPLQFARAASRELGGWCADQVWLYCLGGDEFKRLVAKTERTFHQKKFALPEILAAQQTRLQDAQDIIRSHTFEAPDFDLSLAEDEKYTSKNLSSKVVKLAIHLKQRFERPTDDKCIVFVERRYTARLLATLFSRQDMGTPHLFVGTLVSDDHLYCTPY
jgi:endoribonuclease Dicer